MQVGSALYNLYTQQLKKINTALEALHEDLRHDYKKDIAYITEIPEPRFGRVLGKKTGKK